MDRKPIAVFGVYLTRYGVESAVEACRDAGFQKGSLSFLLPEKMSTEDLFVEEGATTSKHATSGPMAVAEVDGPLGWLDEIGHATIPGHGRFLVAGPLAKGLEEINHGRKSWGLVAALASIGISENERTKYEEKIRLGEALVSIHCNNLEEAEIARHVHSDVGAAIVFSTG